MSTEEGRLDGTITDLRQQLEAITKERDDYRAEVADLLPRLDADAVGIGNLLRELAEAKKSAAAACHLADEWRKEVSIRTAQIEELHAFAERIAAMERICRVAEDNRRIEYPPELIEALDALGA